MDADLEFDDTFDDDDEIELDEEPPRRRSPLRIILLVLVVLVLLCLVCFLGSRLLGGMTNIVPVSSLPSQVQSLLGVEEEPPPPPPAIDTTTPELMPTEEIPPEETSEPAPTEEPPTPDTGELPATTEPTEEPAEGEGGSTPRVVHPGRDAVLDPGDHGIRTGEDELQLLEESPEHAVQDRLVELALVLEVVDDRRPPDADSLGDLLQAGGVEAALGKEGLGGVEDSCSRLLGPRSVYGTLGHGQTLPARR